MLKFGRISDIQADKGLFQVTFDESELVSDWLFGAARNTKDNKDECPFAMDEHVACIMDERCEHGVVAFAIYDQKNLPAIGDKDVSGTTYKDGSFSKVNKETGEAEMQFQKITINGGENDGLAKVKELTEKFNAIEDELTSLKNGLKPLIGSTPPYVALPTAAAGAPDAFQLALAGTLGTWVAQPIVKTQQEDIENPDITH